MDIQKTFLGGTVLFFLLLSLLMLAPFLTYIITAIILAFVLRPVQVRLQPKIGKNLSAILIITGFTVLIALPFALAVGTVATDALELVDNVGEVEFVDFEALQDQIFELTGQEVDIEQELQDVLESFTAIAVGGVSQILGVLTSLLIGLLIMSFSLFYLLKDGDRLYGWIRSVTPVKENIQNQMYNRAGIMTNAVLKGHVLVAIAEGLIGGLALYLTGIPNAAFWTFIMIILCFIPVVGAFLIWAPASIYLLLMNEVTAGIFLALYGLIVISLADNLLRPYLVDKKAELQPAVILIGVIGGVYLFGAIGLFIGPVIFGLTKTITEVFTQNYEKLD